MAFQAPLAQNRLNVLSEIDRRRGATGEGAANRKCGNCDRNVTRTVA
jgi:hypothetical protein